MKKALKIIVPILLALVVLGSIGWYLLVYDSAFTLDVLLHGARHFENKGNHAAAVKIYNLAYQQADSKQDVALELAAQFVAMDNYTQAECTLSEAIADGASAELYLALCKTYVQQDKLLDAAALLDHIGDPAIKQELDAMRPAVPAPKSEPGFYNQHIALEFQPQEGTLYVTVDGDYPSIEDVPYTQPYTLPSGETKVHALTVGENGLVSPLAVYGYTVVGVIEPVTLKDPAVDAQVRQLLQIPQDQQIYTDDLWTLTEFTVPMEAEDYSDLAGMIGLQKLTVENGRSSDWTFLTSLDKLTTLKVRKTPISAEAMQQIGQLPVLERLSLVDCGLSDISPLNTAVKLTYLNLGGNSIRDLSALTAMTALDTLKLQHNAVNSVEALQTLEQLTDVDLSYNNIASITALGRCNQIHSLDLSHNKVSDLTALKSLPALTHFYASHNMIQNASALVTCLQLQEINISNNKVTDISGFSVLESLEKLDFSYNSVTVLPSWNIDCALKSLDGSYNDIDSVEPLADLMSLYQINLDYNPRLASIDPLAGCFALVQVDVYGTQVVDVTALTDHNIIVHFDPTAVVITEATEGSDEEGTSEE